MKNYKTLFNNLPFSCLLYERKETEFYVREVNKKFLEVTGKNLKDIIDKSLNEAFPQNPLHLGYSGDILKKSLEKVLSSGQPDIIKQLRYDLFNPESGEFEVKYWDIENIPVPEDEKKDIVSVLNVVKDVTVEVLEKKKREELQALLLEKKEKHRHFIEKNPDGLYSLDLKGNFTSLNQGLVEIAETPEEDLLKMNFLPFCASHDKPRIWEFFKKATLGENQKFEADFVSGKGRKLILDVSLVPIKVGQNITGVYGIARDITSLRLSENALELSEKKFKALVQEGSDLIAILHPDGTFKFLSDTAYSVLGLEPSKYVGKNAFDFIHPEDRERVFEVFTSLSSIKQAQVDSYRFLNGEGEWRWLESKATNLYSEPGVEGIVVNSRDITERIDFQKILIESEEKYRSVFENTLDAVLITIPDGQILAANPAACKMFQRTEAQLCSMGRAGIVDETDARVTAALELREKVGKADVELIFARKDGSKFTGEITSSIFYNKDGNIRTSTIIRDITQKKQLEESLRRSREKYKYLFTHNPLPNWIYDNKTLKIIDVNEAAIKHYGYSRIEFLQLKITDLREEEDQATLMQYLNRQQNEDYSRFGKAFHKKKDGSLIKVEVSSYKFNFDQRDCTLVVSQDITAKESVTQKLRDREAKLRTAQKIARLGYWEQDFTKDNLYWTTEVYKIWGRNRKTFKTSVINFLETIHPEDLECFKKEMKASLSGLKNMDVEHRIILPDGSIKWVQERGKLVLNDLGEPVKFEGTVQDITEAKQRMQELTLSEARHFQILNSQTNYLIRIDLEGSYTYVNRKFSKDFEWMFSGRKIIGQDSRVTVKEYHLASVVEVLEKCREFPNTVQSVEIDKHLENGGVKHTLWDFTCLTDAEGKPVEFQGVGLDITDRVRAEKLLKESNRRYELVSQATSEAIYDWDCTSGHILWSDAYTTLFGYDVKEILPSIDSWAELVHPEDTSIIEDLYSKINGTAEKWLCEYRYKKANGEYAHVVERGIIVRDENGKPVRMVGAVQDVTEKKKLEQLLNKAISLSRIGSYEIDLVKNQIYWSSMTKEIHEVVLDFIPDFNKAISFYREESREEIIAAYTRAINEGVSFEKESKIVTAQGNERWVRVMGEPVLEEGKCVKVSGSFQDIDKVKRAELEALKASEEKLQILESIGDAFLALDYNWIVTYFNQKAEEVLHCPKDLILGKKLGDVFAIKDTLFEFYYKKAIEDNETQHFEAFYEAHHAWYEVHAYPSINGLSVYFRDVTKRKKADQTLRDLNKNLKKYTEELVVANKGLEQFSYIISHNLRSPVANILGLTHLLEDEQYPEVVKIQLRQELYESAQRLDEVIKDLNQILQVKNSFSDIKEAVDLNYLVSSIKSTLKEQIKKEQVSIVTDFCEVDTITSVPGYFHSIFYNLIFNSIKFRQLNIPPVIEIKSMKDGEMVNLVIKDNGMGIDMAKKGDEIFGLYKRFHRHVEGKGMGLFMVKTQIEMLGGKISVYSEINKGTTFVLSFKEDAVLNFKKEENGALCSN